MPIGGSGQDIRKQNDKYMPFVINTLIMSYVHHPITEIEGKKIQKCPNAHLYTIPVYPMK